MLPSNEWFQKQLRQVLHSLYDPRVLRESPLTGLLVPVSCGDPGAALRRAVSDAIEYLKPGPSVPADCRARRVYELLRRRYIEQLTQQEVAADLGLSVRQLQREEKVAREALAAYLWRSYELDSADVPGEIPGVVGIVEGEADAQPPTSDDELAWLRNSSHPRLTRVPDLVERVLERLEPLRIATETTVVYRQPEDLPTVYIHEAMLHQGLLNVLSTALSCGRGGSVSVLVGRDGENVSVEVSLGVEASCRSQIVEAENLDMAARLVSLGRGRLEVLASPTEVAVDAGVRQQQTVCIRVELPLSPSVRVLVIDDNADVLQLFRRYLSETRYQFLGARDADTGLNMAQRLVPDVIVLDIMMPDQDGWGLLGRLREHPETEHIPVVVSTILAQAELAAILGAAGFLRKPITRSELLAALDLQIGASLSISE
jgi:CheY-like chemotaxis protein/transcriptional regulator with XRE-family HTH domain